MAQLFEEEKKYPDNKARKNFVFLGYPHEPPLPRDDYRRVIKELEEELPLRLWYFLDEITTTEMMRKIWRAILRSDLAIFDISRGNPNVAFELGLAVAQNKTCITILKTGEPNPLGKSDLAYAERAEYSSAATLKTKIRELLISKSGAIKLLYQLSYEMHNDNLNLSQQRINDGLIELLIKIYRNKKISKSSAIKVIGNEKLTNTAMNRLRELEVLQVEGQKRGAKWIFTDLWVTSDHEVAGE